MNGALAAYWKTIASAIENARGDLSEREFDALQLGIARELGLVERSDRRGRPVTPLDPDVVTKGIRLLEEGRLSERRIATRLGISRRQLRSIRETMA